jgi:transcriptional regulator with XRE-family HTH domain
MNGKEIKATLGKNIKNLRASRQYSQAILAEKANISVTYLSKIERGLKFPKPDILSRLAEGLEVELYELFKADYVAKSMLDYTVPVSETEYTKRIINRLSKEMSQKMNRTMKEVFKHYQK